MSASRGTALRLLQLAAALLVGAAILAYFLPRARFEFFLQSAIGISTPLLFAAMGELLAEKAGLINIGLEGVVLAGAFAGFAVTSQSGSLWAGVLGAMGAGLLCAVLFGAMCVTLRNDQIVTGAALNFLAIGVTGLLYRTWYGATGSTRTLAPFPEWHFGALSELPYLGPALFSQTSLTYLALGLALVLVGLDR